MYVHVCVCVYIVHVCICACVCECVSAWFFWTGHSLLTLHYDIGLWCYIWHVVLLRGPEPACHVCALHGVPGGNGKHPTSFISINNFIWMTSRAGPYSFLRNTVTPPYNTTVKPLEHQCNMFHCVGGYHAVLCRKGAADWHYTLTLYYTILHYTTLYYTV
jgi:hypothetical protein